MKRLKTEVIASCLFVLCGFTSAVLTGYEHREIADNGKFGCQWQGGSSPGLICNCMEDAEEMRISKNSISSYDTATIEINGCKRVRFESESVAEMRTLRNVRLKNIESLYFEEHGLKWHGYRNGDEDRFDLSVPSLKITIENSTITQISAYTFEGRINSIKFENAVIENADSFAFNALTRMHDITLKNVELRNPREQTFKKFYTDNFELKNVSSGIIPSRYLHNITVYKTLKITDCAFETVRPGAFIVYSGNLEVTNTRVGRLEGEAFKVTTKGDALFKNNHFNVIDDGAFSAILLDESVPKATISFDSNVLTTLTRGSLDVRENFEARFSNMYINETCDCKNIEHNIKETQFYAEIQCKLQDTFITVEDFKANRCSIIESYSNVIIIVVVVCTLCFIIVSVLVVYYRRVYLSKKYGNEKTTKKGNMSLIVPDGRTYRETELHVIVERADLLTTDL